MSSPFVVYNNGARAVTINCGQGFSISLPPGASVELARPTPQKTWRRRPKLAKGTPEYAAEEARLDRELDEYMAADPRRAQPGKAN